MSERTPPLARDLSGVQVRYDRATPETPTPGTNGEDPQALVRRLTAALEDIVAFALSSADYKERAIMMHRRAVAALSGGAPARPAEQTGARGSGRSPSGPPAPEGDTRSKHKP
ncbi:MAG TPA: hypothetical protein VFL93_14960 [Longimicrobiaceae bacterium]|nr:hypothetical protein [Longimicrobiaceae bacterium]